MGLCDPKAIRDGKAWADVVNKKPMNECPSCTHGRGFRCNQCWPPKAVQLAKPEPRKINDLGRF